jgi:hypothetical protein
MIAQFALCWPLATEDAVREEKPLQAACLVEPREHPGSACMS